MLHPLTFRWPDPATPWTPPAETPRPAEGWLPRRETQD